MAAASAPLAAKYDAVAREIRRLERTGVPGGDGLNALLAERGTAPVDSGSRLIDVSVYLGEQVGSPG